MTAEYGAVTVRALPVTDVKTFQQYADSGLYLIWNVSCVTQSEWKLCGTNTDQIA